MEETLTISLSTPIEHNGQRYTEITFREPLITDIIAAQKKPVALQGVFLLAAAASVHSDIIERMPISKFRQAQVFVETFLGDGPPTG